MGDLGRKTTKPKVTPLLRYESGGAGERVDGLDREPSELIFFKLYKSQIPVIEDATETAGVMLGSSKSSDYCLEMICADFLAGTSMEGNNPDFLLQWLTVTVSGMNHVLDCAGNLSANLQLRATRRE